MEDEVDAQPIWIGSLPDRVTHNGTKHRWSSLISTPFLQSEFDASDAEFGAASYPANVIFLGGLGEGGQTVFTER